jgi:hypothetical protein
MRILCCVPPRDGVGLRLCGPFPGGKITPAPWGWGRALCENDGVGVHIMWKRVCACAHGGLCMMVLVPCHAMPWRMAMDADGPRRRQFRFQVSVKGLARGEATARVATTVQAAVLGNGPGKIWQGAWPRWQPRLRFRSQFSVTGLARSGKGPGHGATRDYSSGVRPR